MDNRVRFVLKVKNSKDKKVGTRQLGQESMDKTTKTASKDKTAKTQQPEKTEKQKTTRQQ